MAKQKYLFKLENAQPFQINDAFIAPALLVLLILVAVVLGAVLA